MAPHDEAAAAVVNELRATTTALRWVALAFDKIDEGTETTPAHCRAADARRAYELGVNALRQYDALTGGCCGGGQAPCATHYAAIVGNDEVQRKDAAIHAAGVAEGRAAMLREVVRARGEGVWHKDGAMAQLRQMAQWARDHNCLAFGSAETAAKIARNVDAACDAIEARLPSEGTE